MLCTPENLDLLAPHSEVCTLTICRKKAQKIWEMTLGKTIDPYDSFKNNVFEIKAYNWDEDNNDWHFYHFESGLKIAWYKYPLRSARSNQQIKLKEFHNILQSCANSIGGNSD